MAIKAVVAIVFILVMGRRAGRDRTLLMKFEQADRL
jgi:hypothetical protein